MTVALGPGAFVAVVGSSGVGKDSLLDYARGRTSAYFPQRVITRPPGDGEEHRPVDETEFEKRRMHGEFAFHWSAHGLRYAIPADVDHAVAAGTAVVANVSRGMLDALALRYARLVVVRVSVSDAVRDLRLRARGREDGEQVAGRLARADPAPDHRADHEIRNDGALADAGDELVRVIAALG